MDDNSRAQSTSPAGDRPSSASSGDSKKDKGKGKSEPASKSKTDDWTEVSEPEERRRIQNRIAQRKFREKNREQKERAQRDAQNLQFAQSSYYVPMAEELPKSRDDPGSGLPWGSIDMRLVVSRGHQGVPPSRYQAPGSYQDTFKHRGIGPQGASMQGTKELSTGGSPVDSLAKMTSKLSLKPFKPPTPTVRARGSKIRLANSFSSSSDRNRKNEVNSLMAEFEALLNHTLAQGARTRGNGGSSGGAGGEEGRSHRSIGLSGPASQGSKRSRDEIGQNESEPSESEDERDGEPKRAKLTSKSEQQSVRRLACPYNRRNPQKHNKHRSCIGPGWSTVHRVKEHIYRTHALPTCCARCGEEFQRDADLTAHQRLPQGCEVREVEQAEGYTKDQEKALRKRTKGLESEEDKWREAYRILFPDDPEDAMPTPYYDDGSVPWESRRDDELDRYERYLQRELPRAVRRRLEEAVASLTDPFVHQLRGQLVDIVRDTQAQLFREYRQSMQGRAPRAAEAGLETKQLETGSQGELSDIVFDLSSFMMPAPVQGTVSHDSRLDSAATANDGYYDYSFSWPSGSGNDSSMASGENGDDKDNGYYTSNWGDWDYVSWTDELVEK
ncbi:hypothetical protein B0T16DRAFT_459143 [Cercophora newfieldiana]|uniref:C2H2-type domain-containing protein n=1 Tax=Cercophora newfieldiana TaxID=92897 RepID=A0AA39XZ19_9PEZI|nr:hypothetical protein B0T16DRAFT_459143 [Cercophora newfieldiana]